MVLLPETNAAGAYILADRIVKSLCKQKIMHAKSPEKVVTLAVRRMLKRGPLGNKMITKLKCYRGAHPHEAQMPIEIDLEKGKQLAEIINDSTNR